MIMGGSVLVIDSFLVDQPPFGEGWLFFADKSFPYIRKILVVFLCEYQQKQTAQCFPTIGPGDNLRTIQNEQLAREWNFQ